MQRNLRTPLTPPNHPRLWGVEDDEAILYEAGFSRPTAEAIADRENSDYPPADWKETRDRLEVMGLPFGRAPKGDGEAGG